MEAPKGTQRVDYATMHPGVGGWIDGWLLEEEEQGEEESHQSQAEEATLVGDELFITL